MRKILFLSMRYVYKYISKVIKYKMCTLIFSVTFV